MKRKMTTEQDVEFLKEDRIRLIEKVNRLTDERDHYRNLAHTGMKTGAIVNGIRVDETGCLVLTFDGEDITKDAEMSLAIAEAIMTRQAVETKLKTELITLAESFLKVLPDIGDNHPDEYRRGQKRGYHDCGTQLLNFMISCQESHQPRAGG